MLPKTTVVRMPHPGEHAHPGLIIRIRPTNSGEWEANIIHPNSRRVLRFVGDFKTIKRALTASRELMKELRGKYKTRLIEERKNTKTGRVRGI